MLIQVYGFDWAIYAERVMPAFNRWLIDQDDSAIRALFEQTWCAHEEQFLPELMQELRIWPRAESFIEGVPRGRLSRREYGKLCSVEQFTALSDRYLHHHAPQLYQNTDAVRAIWGAIIETFCLPWSPVAEDEPQSGSLASRQKTTETMQEEQAVQGELVSLLEAAGLGELAQEMEEQISATEIKPMTQASVEIEQEGRFISYEVKDGDEEEDEQELHRRPSGVVIGPQANVLHLRGWLAGISVRAMAYFEYLACGRRCMPFGYEATEPFGSYIGYVTPEEVWQFAQHTRAVEPPNQAEAEADDQQFRKQQGTGRLVDEVLPMHTAGLLTTIQNAADEGLGLICRAELVEM